MFWYNAQQLHYLAVYSYLQRNWNQWCSATGCCPENSAVSRKQGTLGTICFWFRVLELQDHELYLCYSHNKLFKVKKKKKKKKERGGKSKTKCTGCQSEWHYCIVCVLLPGALHFKNTCCGFSVIIFPLPVLYLPYCKYPFVQSCFSFLARVSFLICTIFLQTSTVHIFPNTNLCKSNGVFWGFLGFFGHAWGMQKFLGLGLNPSHSSDNAESLTARPPGNSPMVFFILQWAFWNPGFKF